MLSKRNIGFLIVFLLLGILFFLGYLMPNNVITKSYDNYADIDKSSGTYLNLPEYFPFNAENIEYNLNFDLNYYVIYFSMNFNDILSFEEELFDISGLDGKNKAKFFFNNYSNRKIVDGWCIYSKGFNGMEFTAVAKLREKGKYYIIGPIDPSEFSP